MNSLILMAALMGQHCEDGQCTSDIYGTPLATVETSATPAHGPVRKVVRRVHQRRPLRRLFAWRPLRRVLGRFGCRR